MKKIDDIKQSLRRAKNTAHILGSITALSDSYKGIEDSALLEYVPVKIVSCFEEHFRQIYCDIMASPQYRQNIKNVKCLKNIRFDLDFINNMFSSNITLTDYLSYNFPCSSLDQIFEHFSSLLGVDFKKCLIDKIIESEGPTEIPIEEGRANVVFFLKTIDLLFRMRHVICHEGMNPMKFNNEFIMQMIEDSLLFLEYIDRLLYDMVYQGIDIDGLDSDSMNRFENTDKELSALVEYIKKNNSDPKPNFNYLDSWKIYREKKAESESESYKDSTMYQTIFAMSMESTTRQMITQIRKEFRLFDTAIMGETGDNPSQQL